MDDKISLEDINIKIDILQKTLEWMIQHSNSTRTMYGDFKKALQVKGEHPNSSAKN